MNYAGCDGYIKERMKASYDSSKTWSNQEK